MTAGILLFAHGLGTVDYGSMAIECARRLKQFVDLPVSVVTDLDINDDVFDSVITHSARSGGLRHWPGTDTTQQWFNVGRSDAFDLSPYDTTILIDSDFLVNSSQLELLVQDTRPFLCHRSHVNLPDAAVQYTPVGKTRTPMAWATVVKFDRSDFSRDVFDIWKMVETNYAHYAAMFGFTSRPFRNDYALTLALLLISGNEVCDEVEIKWPLINVTTGHDVVINGSQIEITYQTMVDQELKRKRISVQGQDVHMMDKRYL